MVHGRLQMMISLHQDYLIVAVKPKPPAKHIRDGFDDDNDDDDLKFQLPQSTSWWKRRLFSFLHDKLKLPNVLLMAIFSLSLKMWAIITMWFILAPVAHRWDLGPIYDIEVNTLTKLGPNGGLFSSCLVSPRLDEQDWAKNMTNILGTGFVIVFLNLGKRQHGDMRLLSMGK